MPARRLYVVAYDIREPRRLARVLAIVKGYATGGQKSVWECWLDDAGLDALLGELEQVIDPEVDSLVVVRPTPPRATRTLGIATPPVDRDWFFY